MYPDALDPEKRFDYPLFNEIDKKHRAEQKSLLREGVTQAIAMEDVVNHPMTDRRPLILPVWSANG
ncbi:MAG: hypothetical protein AAGC81_10910 [Pseudomonadota bacterium]